MWNWILSGSTKVLFFWSQIYISMYELGTQESKHDIFLLKQFTDKWQMSCHESFMFNLKKSWAKKSYMVLNIE